MWISKLKTNHVSVKSLSGRGLVLVFVPLLCTGCVSAWWNSFLNPTELGNFRENRVNEIQRTISFRDKPAGVVGATDPTPDDLVALVSEYEVGPGDRLFVQLADFLEIGSETSLPILVDELGQIDLPQLGKIHIDKMTVTEIKNEIIQQAKAKEIYREDDVPTVLVTVEEARQRIYYLDGDVQYQNTFAIPRPDFRLHEAVLLGGGLGPMIKTIYVFRDEPRQTKTIRRRTDDEGPSAAEKEAEPAPAPPVSPVLMSSFSESGGPLPPPTAGNPQPSTRTASEAGLALPIENAEQELIDAVAPDKTSSPTPDKVESSSQPAPSPTETPSRLPSYIFVNDRFIEAPSEGQEDVDQTIETPPEAPPETPETPADAEPVDWEELASEGQRRVIRIPANRLRNGDSNYNVVVRSRDRIRVDAGPQGLYYLTGHVLRPGPYPFSGEEITLTQAIATAGGLDQVAWPTRCEIRRRIDQDREEITQWDLARIVEGKDPDLYLKPNDIVRVGTHAVAPLLATIRNSFRLTYGFGFVYDRNFADIDAYGGDINPTLRRRSEQQQRFPGLFQ